MLLNIVYVRLRHFIMNTTLFLLLIQAVELQT